MNQIQIDYFIAVAKARNLSQAARELFVSPPAVSKQISALEAELEVELFFRSGRGVELTIAGQMLLDHFLSAQNSLTKILREAKAAEAMQTSTFRLGIIEDWNIYDKLAEIKRFVENSARPSQLLVRGENPNELLEDLKKGDLDAVICISNSIIESRAERHEIDCVPLTEIRKIFLYSASNPLAEKDKLIPLDFAGQPLLSISNESKIMAQEENILLCNNYGFNPKIRTLPDIRSILLTVGSGLGFTVVDEWSSEKSLPGFNHLVLDEFHYINFSRLKSNSHPVLDELAAFCADLFKSRSGASATGSTT